MREIWSRLKSRPESTPKQVVRELESAAGPVLGEDGQPDPMKSPWFSLEIRHDSFLGCLRREADLL